MASSDDGSKVALIALSNGGNGVWTSGNGGLNWALQTSGLPSSTQLAAIVSSGNGNKLALVDAAQGIFTSINGGTSWVAKNNGITGSPLLNLAGSNSGDELVTGVYGGSIFTTTDGGNLWVQRSVGLPSGGARWAGFASSDDGVNLLAVSGAGGGVQSYVVTSNDGGGTWTQRTNANGLPANYNNVLWAAVASSGNGATLLISDNGGQGYCYLSYDGGVSWTQATGGLPNGPGTAGFFNAVMSNDGTKMAVSVGDKFYTSSNSGLSWSLETNGLPASGLYSGLASSFSGDFLITATAGFATTSFVSAVYGE